MKKIFGLILLGLVSFVLVGCPNNNQPKTFEVKFDTGENGTVFASQFIKNGGKVDDPGTPTRDGFHFTGNWKHGASNWNFDLDIVTGNMTLVAEWTEVTTTPTNILMSDDAFSSVIIFNQASANVDSISVQIKADNGSYVDLAGTALIIDEDVVDTVSFTPTTIPAGGYYTVKIKSGTAEGVSAEALLFAGSGSASNPYLASKVKDITSLLDNVSYSDKHFLQVADISSTLSDPITIDASRKISFSGTYDGGNKNLLFTGDGGLFHKINASGVVKNLSILEGTTISSMAEDNYPVGSIADENSGKIENITSRAQVTDSRLQGTLTAYSGSVDVATQTTGAGGIVGINKESGQIKNVTVSGSGAVKAGRGIGGVAAWNFGLIQESSVSATLPAGNQANSGKTTNSYSYGGGVAGFNLGTIDKCVVSGRVFAQSAYAAAGNGNELIQVGFGGIAGYNAGTISECSFARSMSVKEFIDKSQAAELNDAANNLGVASIHGDAYVGGLSGINAGRIKNSYVGGALIGGRDYIGGVAGLTLGDGNISNTYVFAEIAIKDDGGIKITAANSKTTVTKYDIAPSGFEATSTFYKPLLNSETGATWAPGALQSPKLPEFLAGDLAIVGNKFASSGVLLWQQGAVTGVNIVLESTVLAHGETATLEYSVTPSNAPDLFTTWTSSDEAIVEIVGDGIIKGVGAGTATVTVTTRDGGHTDIIEVTVQDYKKITDVTVTATKNGEAFVLPAVNDSTARPKIEIGTTLVITVSVLPEDADYQGYTISSSNTRGVAKDNEFTFALGSGYGSVSIYIDFDDSSVGRYNYRFETIAVEEAGEITGTASCAEVTLGAEGVQTDKATVEYGTVLNIVVSFSPSNPDNMNYTISFSNGRLILNDDGTISVRESSPGNVTLTITFEDDSIPPLAYYFTTVDPEATT